MALTELWLVRHGESIANVAATRAELEGADVIPIDTYWVSPYLRARQTLTIALGVPDTSAAISVDERLRDRELGILDLLTRQGVARLHPGEAERRRHLGKFYHRPPGGESWADVALRLRSFLR